MEAYCTRGRHTASSDCFYIFCADFRRETERQVWPPVHLDLLQEPVKATTVDIFTKLRSNNLTHVSSAWKPPEHATSNGLLHFGKGELISSGAFVQTQKSSRVAIVPAVAASNGLPCDIEV